GACTASGCTPRADTRAFRTAARLHHSMGRDLDEAPPLDVFLHPGGQGTRRQLADEEHLQWMRSLRGSVPLMTSVCTGSLVFAAAGLLTHRPATTHWASLEKLSQLDPTIQVRAGERFVDDGDTVTSAGISAGIDMALHLVARLTSAERAEQVRRGIQYDWQAPAG
ncbi:DJ-1/PfpI family protein, partial [Streptomyces sp. NPDC050625]|uniref:DJ-1/PfpI family protein n=1 Tax=Streptomyces sp. NPDC050625 TaxID=3154629 RepID=UPI003441208F